MTCGKSLGPRLKMKEHLRTLQTDDPDLKALRIRRRPEQNHSALDVISRANGLSLKQLTI
jgi:hypothetical protein